MTDKKNTHGGSRPGAGRPPRSPDGAAKRRTYWITPENLKYLSTIPAGERGPLINRLLDLERKKMELSRIFFGT